MKNKFILIIIIILFACGSGLDEKIITKILKRDLVENIYKIIGIQKKENDYIVKTILEKNSESITVFFKFCKYNSGWQIDEFKIGNNNWSSYSTASNYNEHLSEIYMKNSFSESIALNILDVELMDYVYSITEIYKENKLNIVKTIITINNLENNVEFSFKNIKDEWSINKFRKIGDEWESYETLKEKLNQLNSSIVSAILSHEDIIDILNDYDTNFIFDLEGVKEENGSYIARVNYSEVPMIMLNYYRLSKYDTGWKIDSYKVKGSVDKWIHFQDMEKTFKELSRGFILSTLTIMKYIIKGINTYITDHGKPPSARNINELEGYITRYIDPIFKEDLWGNKIIYKMWVDKSNGRKHYNLISTGFDGELGNEDDIVFQDGRLMNSIVLND